MTRRLRSYQLEACDAITNAWGKGMMRPAIVLPTGTGKTDCIAKIATDTVHQGGRVLALAHRGELLDQITERCRMHDPTIPIGRVQAERDQTRRPITVAMAQTLRIGRRRARLPRPDVVIVDEAHHAVSDSYLAILQWAGSFDATRTMGVTATMGRGDVRGLGDCWQDVVYTRDIRWAIDEKFLVEPRGRAVVADHMRLEQAKISRGDYQDNELGDMVEQDVDQIVKAWQAHAGDRITIAFVPNVASAQALANEFRVAGVPVAEVYGTTPSAERGNAAKGTGIYGALARGEIRVLINVMVATEGLDVPAVSCILMARPTRNAALYVQMVGRGLRPHPESGKADCLVLDVVGTSRRQKLATLIDLHRTAEYDATELDTVPCDVCGGAPRGQRLTEEAPFQCRCGSEDGGEDDGRIQLPGPVEYSEVDLFATSSLNWLFTRSGLRFLPAGNRLALLWPAPCGDEDEDEQLYVPGHCEAAPRWVNSRPTIGGGQWLPDGKVMPLPLHDARVLAERWAADHDASLSSRKSSWRRGGARPTDAQLHAARRLGIAGADSMSKARLSDEISIAKASRLLDRITA